MNFICAGCASGDGHADCVIRNDGRHTADCDCQHVKRAAPPGK